MTLQFKVGDIDYRIIPDPYCWVLQRQTKPKPGVERKGDGWTNLRYGSIHNHARWLVDQGCKGAQLLRDSEDYYNIVCKEVAESLIRSVEAIVSNDRAKVNA